LTLETYSRNAGNVGWVSVGRYVMGQWLPPVQKHLSLTLYRLCKVQVCVFTWQTITVILCVTTFMFWIAVTITVRDWSV